MTRLFVSEDQLSGNQVSLDKEQLHHLTRVLKAGEGDKIEIVEPGRQIIEGKIQFVGKREVKFDPIQTRELPPAPSPEIHLIQALPKQDKMTEIIRAAVECGVSKIVPCESVRSLPGKSDVKVSKVERWRKTALSAAIQSQQYRQVDITSPDTLNQINTFPGTIIVPWEEAPQDQTIRHLYKSLDETPDVLSLVIGPEGGFDKREIEHLTKHGAHIVSLGSTILRVEHAALFAIAQIKAEY